MPNYRTNSMAYNNCRQTQNTSSMARRDIWNDKALAMAYVPWQTWRDIYDVEKGFCCGTIFKELDLPFLGKGGVKR